jgi:hypothetical protein
MRGGSPMSFDPDIANLRMRIAKAESDMGHWRTSGNQEKYLEAHSFVEALELDLDRLRRQRIDSAKRSASYPRDERAPQPPAAQAASPPKDDAGERERLMTAHEITPAGRQYQFSHYLYDRFEDALGYAKKQRLAPSASDEGDSLPPARLVEAPDERQRRLMRTYGITFDAGVYHLAEYRYDRLADAMNYAGVLDRAEAFPGSIRDPNRKASLS